MSRPSDFEPSPGAYPFDTDHRRIMRIEIAKAVMAGFAASPLRHQCAVDVVAMDAIAWTDALIAELAKPGEVGK